MKLGQAIQGLDYQAKECGLHYTDQGASALSKKVCTEQFLNYHQNYQNPNFIKLDYLGPPYKSDIPQRPMFTIPHWKSYIIWSQIIDVA